MRSFEVMSQEELQAALEAIARSGITVNGDLVLEKKVDYEVANVETGGIGIQINNNYGGEKQTPLAINDREIKEVIIELLQAKNEDGALLFRNKKQWWAVFRVLAEYFNFPTQMRSFVTKMKELEIAVVDGDRDLSYESLNKAPKDVPLMSVRVSSWNTMKDKSANYKQQYEVAEFLMRKLGILS